MHYTLLAIQCLGIGIIFYEMIHLAKQRPSKLQTLLLLIVGAILINNFGYTLEIAAPTKEIALQAVRFSYLGKPFILYLMYIFVMEYCGFSLPAWGKRILFSIAAFISILVLSSNYNTLFYSHISFTNSGLFPHLILEHGPIYKIYTCFFCFYFICMFYACIYYSRKHDSLLIRKQVLLLISMLITCILGLLIFLSKITAGYDTTAPAYIICVILLEQLIQRYKLFDSIKLAKEEAVEHMKDGLIVLNEFNNISYTNSRARELLDFVGFSEKDPLSYIKEQIQNHQLIFVTTKFDTDCTHHDVYDKCVYEGSLREITHDDQTYGTMIILTEITDRYYYTERLQTDVARKTKKMIAMQRSLIGSFATIIEARDGITGLHIKNTGNFVKILTNAMRSDPRFASQMTAEYAEMVADAAHLHDIGKISIPDSILQKKGKLTEEEFTIMKSHPTEGARILEETIKGVESDEYFQIAHDMALYHHEKYDGSGYPSGLSGNDIPLSARIMAVADVYDALRSSRHYKEGFSQEKSMAIIEESRGSHFDPDIAEIFLSHIDEIEAVFEVR